MGRFNRTPDTDLEIASSVEYTATGTSTAVAIPSAGAGDNDMDLILNVSALGGTHDASNYFKLELEASDDNATFAIVDGFAVTTDTIATGANLFAINFRQITEAVGNQDAGYYRLNVTKVGTTATGATLSASFAKGA